MKTFSLKYRVPGAKKFVELNGVTNDGMETVNGMQFRFFLLEDGTFVHIPFFSEVYFGPERIEVTRKQMSKDAGIDIPLA